MNKQLKKTCIQPSKVSDQNSLPVNLLPILPMIVDMLEMEAIDQVTPKKNYQILPEIILADISIDNKYNSLVLDSNFGIRYQVDDIVDRGAFAKVYRASVLYRNENKRRSGFSEGKSIVAVKHFPSVSSGRNDECRIGKPSCSLKGNESRKLVLTNNDPTQDHFASERFALRKLSMLHRNIVTLYDEGANFLVLEFATDDLYNFISRNEVLDEATLIKFQHQLCSALDAVHAAGFAHLDIKPENILLKNGIDHILLADFGCARQVTKNKHLIKGVTGTLMYNAPEVSDDVPFEPFPCDIWSLACVYFICLTGAPPFDNAISCPSYLHVRDNNWDAFWSVHEGVSKHHQDRFMEMVTLPNYRPCAHHLATVMFPEEERTV